MRGAHSVRLRITARRPESLDAAGFLDKSPDVGLCLCPREGFVGHPSAVPTFAQHRLDLVVIEASERNGEVAADM